MKNIIIKVLATLGVIFLLLIIMGSYFYVTDPYGLKPLLFGGSAQIQTNTTPSTNVSETEDSNTSPEQGLSGGFELSSAQKEALVSLGIDPAAVPSSISAEQERCFVEVLGEARVAEIKAGAVPNAIEFLKAKACI